jgi:TRAP-type mannitol/chloroaromatic compound transport system permease small subunit
MQTDKSGTSTGEMPRAIRVADRLRKIVDVVGAWGCWLIVPVVVFTCIDVIGRKIGYEDEETGRMYRLQGWLADNLGSIFQSTILQELEWHFHAALFALVLGYGVIYNTHVRIDLIRDSLDFRKKAWLEFMGLTFFLIPYCAIVIYFAFDYTYASYLINESSNSTVGLSHRWIIKSVFIFGMLVAVISGIAAWLQVVTILWGPKDLRFPLMTLDWPETDAKIEGKTRVKLEDEYGLRLSDPTAPTDPTLAGGTSQGGAKAPPRA